MKQRLAELVFDMEVRRRREDEVRHLVALVAEGVDHAHRRVDVALGRAHHANDLEVRTQLTSLPPFEDEPQRLALTLGHRRKPHVHNVDPDVGKHPRELVLVLWGDGDPGPLLAVAQRVVVDANLVWRWELQVVGEPSRVAGELFERFLKLYGFGLIHERWLGGGVLRDAGEPTARARPCAAARS